MNIQPNKNIQILKPYTCARDLYKTGVFLDANENYDQWIKIDWSKITNLNRYPDSSCDDLRQKLVEKYIKGSKKENIFVASGSDEIIDLLIRGFVDKQYIMAMNPSYGIYETQININNKKIKSILLKKDFGLNIKIIKNNIKNVKLIFLCSPNNPTGNLITESEIKTILSFYKGLLVIDEAYVEFAGLKNSLLRLLKTNNNIVILRTFSKAWGLAGIRVGYAVADEKIISILLKIKESYNVSKVSQLIILQALDQVDRLKTKVSKTMVLKANLEKKLKNLKFEIIPTNTNFILIRLNNATKIYKKLAKEGVIVRDRSNLPYLNNVLRITIGSKEENNLLIKKLLLASIDGIIFDMDGVLVDVSQSYREAIRRTAGYFLKRNVLISEVNEIKNKIGMNNDWDATYALINKSTVAYESVKAYFQKIYLGGLINNEKLLIPKQKLKLLKNKYKKLGIATGRPKQEAGYVIKKNKLEEIFDCIIALEDVVNSKPSPDCLLAVMKKLDLKQTVYIGDSASDVIAAERAKIPSIFVGKQNIGTVRFQMILEVIQYLL